MRQTPSQDSLAAWTMVAIGGVLGCIAIGSVFSLAVFLGPITQSTGWSRTAVSSAMTLTFLAMGVGGFAWGAASDRFGARIVVLLGSVVLGSGLALASRAPNEGAFVLVYGIVVGGASGSIFVPVISTVSNLFDRHRALAISLVSAGMGMAPLTMSPLAAWLITHMDWRAAQLTMAGIVWAVMIPLALLVRNRGQTPLDEKGLSPVEGVARALRSPQFIVLGLTFFACCATHSGPIFHTVSYAMSCGIPTMAAVSIYSVEGLAGLGGRVVLGLLGDRYGAKRILILGLSIQALAAGAFVFAQKLDTFYAVALVFGFAYGGTMPLYAVLAREYFGQRILGTVLGAATMLSAFGMALGPVVGGWIFDHSGRYTWLYLGSFGMGLTAVLLALLFPPVVRAARSSSAAGRPSPS